MPDADDLLRLLKEIPPKRLTVFANISRVFWGHPRGGPAIGAMLRCLHERGDGLLTSLVVRGNGELPRNRAGGVLEQRRVLKARGIPLLPNGRVDLANSPPYDFPKSTKPAS